MSRTPSRRRSLSSPADTRLPSPAAFPAGARQGAGSLGWLGRLELQHPALWGGSRAGARCALAVGNPNCSTIALTPVAPFTYANTLKPASTPQARQHIQGERPFQQPGPVQTGVRSFQRLLHRRGKGGALLRKLQLRPCLREHPPAQRLSQPRHALALQQPPQRAVGHRSRHLQLAPRAHPQILRQLLYTGSVPPGRTRSPPPAAPAIPGAHAAALAPAAGPPPARSRTPARGAGPFSVAW
jgi:hypothetical protein